MIRNNLQDLHVESKVFKNRVVFIAFFCLLCILILLVNSFNLQFIKHKNYATKSNDNRVRLVTTEPNRGLIFDRNGVLLADNRPVYSIEIIREQSDDLEKLAAELATFFNIAKEDKDEFLKKAKVSNRFSKLVFASDLTEEQRAQFAVVQYKYPGTYIEARLSRFYPKSADLTHALGYVARINQNDLARLKEQGIDGNYRATRNIGKLGVEKYYENLLHGTSGYKEVEVNNRGRTVRILSEKNPVAGSDIMLNIDYRLQKLATKLLDGRKGSVVAIDPSNGGILSFVSAPTYNPNLFVNGISQKDYRAIISSNDNPLLNRITQGQYPPASTIKPHIALLGLRDKVITKETTIFDPGYYQPKGVRRRFRDWLRTGHGVVDLYHAIGASCDTYYYELSHKLGIDKISSFMGEFGFGKPTNIDINEDNSANLPTRDWKRAKYNQPWYLGDTLSVGIGQGYWTVTPMQLVVSIATIANHGKVYTPRILKSAKTDPSLNIKNTTHNHLVNLNLDNYWDDVIEAMIGVNHSKEGTARAAFRGAKYTSAGKTGTGQVISIADDEVYDASKIAENLRDHAMYVGFAPVENPKIAIAVIVENAGGGSSFAAPIARKIMDKYLN